VRKSISTSSDTTADFENNTPRGPNPGRFHLVRLPQDWWEAGARRTRNFRSTSTTFRLSMLQVVVEDLLDATVFESDGEPLAVDRFHNAFAEHWMRYAIAEHVP
jgi:hypothetical protein